jgi:HK97 gp10 family phage protein
MSKLSIRVNFKQELERIKKDFKIAKNNTVEERTAFATESLARVTPIDTGYARSRWEYKILTINGESIGVISNDADYIDYLNKGSSKQAPPYFIERTLIAIGELSAPVLEYKD